MLNGEIEASNNIMTTKIMLLTVTAVFIILYSRRTELLIKQESSYGTIISESKVQENGKAARTETGKRKRYLNKTEMI
jgi:hypothetical protein